jgi:hypothetical protein
MEGVWSRSKVDLDFRRFPRPAIATDLNNAIHVVWTEDTPNNDEIYCNRSTDGGMSWVPLKG